MNQLTLEQALKMIEAAERWARDIAGSPCSIAVLDKAGAVIAVHRMDGAGMATTDIAIEKAWTSVAFKMPTLMGSRWLDPRNIGKLLGDHAMGMIGRGKGRLCFIPGGIRVTDEENEVIGAIGCSGVPSGVGDISDTSVSQAGVTALYDERK
ncbi:MAG: heme-binding protein [Deltaproteobacteria bacterium]|nr:heme-binding protein [Deltaproteobacteria bacterium]